MKILHAVGARPNFMKAAPVVAAMAKRAEFDQFLVHTGQHYDDAMSRNFFIDLELPEPDAHLGVGSGSHAQQTAKILMSFEEVALEWKPDWLVVYGDVNSTLACALTAAKLGVSVAHVEAGLRSFDRKMPEELNRILTDQLSDLLFTTEESANRNLLREGCAPEKIHFVGNVMIDTLLRLLPRAKSAYPELASRLGVNKSDYVLVTLHRPFNVDCEARLSWILRELGDICRQRPVVFPVHPRTRIGIQRLGTVPNSELRLLDPLGYLDFLALQAHAALVLTDSGGVQEETTRLGVPCLTLRPNTERPSTIESGTNRLASYDKPLRDQITSQIEESLRQAPPAPPELWDGAAATRITEVFLRRLD